MAYEVVTHLIAAVVSVAGTVATIKRTQARADVDAKRAAAAQTKADATLQEAVTEAVQVALAELKSQVESTRRTRSSSSTRRMALRRSRSPQAYATDVGHLVHAAANTAWYVIAYNSILPNTAYALLLSCDGTGAGIVIEVGTFTGGTMPAASGQRVVLGGGWSSAGALLSGRSAVEAWWTRVLTTAEKSAAKAILRREYI